MTLISLCPVERSAELIKEGLSTIHSHAVHQEKIIKELREQLALSEDKVRELTHENYDYDNLIPDGVDSETFEWIEDRLEKADAMEEENKELTAENMELEKKSNAKSDIIRNMFDRLIKDANIDDGFYIGRDWGNKYIDEWNKIVSEEIQEAIKDINENNEEFEIRTNGYQFDFHYPESESESEEEEEVPKEEYVPQGSKVDMEAFNKLKEDGMMPWSK